MDSAKKAIKEKINSVSIEEAREFVATYHGSKGSEYHSFAVDCLAAKEAAGRDAFDSHKLIIAHKTAEIIDASINPKWYSKPSGIIFLGVISGLLVAGFWYFYVQH
jgi:hypothetical protein